MFWGLIMEPERRYTQKVKKAFHISMAAMDISSSGDEPSQVMCGYDGRNYLLCTLRKPDMIQCPLELEFAEGTEVSFASNGKAHIHLTGYLTDIDDAEGFNLEDLEEEQEDEEVPEEQKPSKKKKKPVENGPPSKKAKMNGVKEEPEEESEEDSDDAEEEAEDEEDSSAEEAEDEEESGEEEEDSDEDEEVEEEEQPKVIKSKKQKQQEAAKSQQMVNGEQKKEKKKGEQQKPAQKKVKLDQGVVIEDLKVGEGPEARPGKFVSVYYEGRLQKNNKMFDSSNKGPGFKFRLGRQEVIKGWDLGVAGMKVGGKRRIVCPPNAAYGAKGSPPVIPPNSTLVFEVELKKVN